MNRQLGGGDESPWNCEKQLGERVNTMGTYNLNFSGYNPWF